MSLTGNWNYPTSIRFGVGRITELAEVCRSQGIQRPLLVTDSGLARAPITTAALDALRAAGATEVVPETIEGSLTLASHALALLGSNSRTHHAGRARADHCHIKLFCHKNSGHR